MITITKFIVIPFSFLIEIKIKLLAHFYYRLCENKIEK
jgi:hypothetical protein